MKKLLSSVSKSALVLYLTLQVTHAMDDEEKKAEYSNSGSKINKSSNKNKEQYHLLKEKFSTENDINFPELCKHIHYTFKNRDLLINALHPLLPATLQRPKKKFEHLEFLGDSVLSVITRERIIALFPDEERGMHNQLYAALICNKTLAEAYLQNLDIEPYLPYPGEKTCQYCNVVEAIIGAIYTDNPGNELVQSRKFIMRILDDHLFIQKRKELLEKEKIKSKNIESNVEISFVLPNIKKAIKEVLEDPNIDQKNTKSLLAMILGKALQDQPLYELSLGKNEKDIPVFVAKVIGSQIGRRITGIGFTKDEAEQDAARNAINFLAQEDRIPQKILDIAKQTYTKFMTDYCQVQGFKLSCENSTPVLNFICQVKVGNTIIGEGVGLSKVIAREEAAHNACNYLTTHQAVSFEQSNDRKYVPILQGWVTQKKISDVNFIEIKDYQPIRHFIFQVNIGGNIIGEGESSTKVAAKEKAAQDAYNYFIAHGKSEYENLKDDKKYKSILEEWLSQKKIPAYDFVETESSQPIFGFKFQVKAGEDVIGEGMGFSKPEAKEEAARDAYDYLIKNEKVEHENLKSDKKYTSLLQNWANQQKISDYQLIETSLQPKIKFQVAVVREGIIGEGEGFSGEAKENAYRSVFEQLLKKQEDAYKHKEIRKTSAKKVKEIPVSTLNPQIANPIIADSSSVGLELENLVEPREKLQIFQKEEVSPAGSVINADPINLERKTLEKQKRKRKKKTAQQKAPIETPVANRNGSQQNGQQLKKQKAHQREISHSGKT